MATVTPLPPFTAIIFLLNHKKICYNISKSKGEAMNLRYTMINENLKNKFPRRVKKTWSQMILNRLIRREIK